VQYIDQQNDSRFSSFSLSFGGGLVRNDIVASINGQGVTTTLNGLYMIAGKQFVDFHTFIEHAKPHSSSRQLYKGILDDNARAVFNGKIYVKQEAQKTDAIQNNKNLLLSETAGVDTQPMLEIFADDVRCTHGGTVGQMDKEALHYMRSRGIGEKLARRLLVQSFAGDVVDKIGHENIKQYIDHVVKAFLQNKYKVD
ncbi:SufD family Fe-S cluster assembly protein, partial [candidate division KSB1 bacterium]|nr:SufD family Fe-S cluster assembly protein [candidate division KSB1 bacterium]